MTNEWKKTISARKRKELNDENNISFLLPSQSRMNYLLPRHILDWRRHHQVAKWFLWPQTHNSFSVSCHEKRTRFSSTFCTPFVMGLTLVWVFRVVLTSQDKRKDEQEHTRQKKFLLDLEFSPFINWWRGERISFMTKNNRNYRKCLRQFYHNDVIIKRYFQMTIKTIFLISIFNFSLESTNNTTSNVIDGASGRFTRRRWFRRFWPLEKQHREK